ncbi:sodium:solute symporter family transporter [Tichowtungia aerotolerans]|uniref:Sodium/solute symporter n=1 Tax=Tichowtungia aerotolerans TaxID=2697043 RepID=A0A6P1M5T7_9BACT|nr:sodium/solute symporter [Tichowtungia aerotolerans]QHI70159.1 sodium/solute symporter [Tichowtungia aerotolerans]
MSISVIDIAVLVGYFLLTIGIGLYFSRKNTNTEEYFLGGRSFPGWALGLSLVGTCMSSITFLSHPADSFKTTLIRMTITLTFPLISMFGMFVLLPFFRRGTISSAYEYLAQRFGRSVSCYAASIFFIIQILRVSTILYLISLLIHTVTGLSFFSCLLMAGGITALYTVSGGFDAVIWTDVLQTITLIFGSFVMIGLMIYKTDGGIIALIQTAFENGKLSMTQDLNVVTGQIEPIANGFSLTEKTFVMLLIVGVVQYLSTQFDQTSIQRWCSAKSPKEARKAIMVLAFSAVPIWASFMLTGTILWAFFRFHPDPVVTEMLTGVRKGEEIVPYFVVNYMPVGLTGLVIAGALAAAMSSLSSSINAASMVWVRDIYKPYLIKGKTDRHYLRIGFLASGAVSLMMLCGAWLFYTTDTKTLNDLGVTITSVCGGGMVGIFLVGVFTRCGDQRSVWIALAVNALVTAYVLLDNRGIVPARFSLSLDLYFTALIGNTLTVISALLASIFFKSRVKDFTNLTVWDQEKSPLV